MTVKVNAELALNYSELETLYSPLRNFGRIFEDKTD
jgi:hypothetical protein